MNRGGDYQQQQYLGTGKYNQNFENIQLQVFQEWKSMQQIRFLHHQDELHLQHLEIKIDIDSETSLIVTNTVLSVHHIRNL